MTERKPANENWESFAERKIREAQAEGAFDSLPGFGRPIADLGEALDENWWLKRRLRTEQINLLPPILEVRLQAEKTLDALWSLTTEEQVITALRTLNERIRKAHYSPAPGPASGVQPIDVNAAVAEWRRRRQWKSTPKVDR